MCLPKCVCGGEGRDCPPTANFMVACALPHPEASKTKLTIPLPVPLAVLCTGVTVSCIGIHS